MDQIALQGVIQVVGVDHFALQQAAFAPAHLPASLLVHQEPAAQLVRFDFEEAGEFFQVHGGVEFEIGFDGRAPHGGFDLVHEDGEVVVDRIDVQFRVVEVGRGGRDEFGAGGAEEVFE